jgi:reactive intermediate/imine deaminase
MKALMIVAGILAAAGCTTAPSSTDGADPPEYLNSGKVLPTNLPFSEAVRVGNTLYLSGQIGNVPGTLELVSGGVEEQTRQVMENIKTSLETHAYSLNDLVKCTVMLADIADWPAFNDVYKTFFTDHYPARSAFGANGLAVGASVEVECIAVQGE